MASLPSSKATVLIVDDEPLSRELLENVLQTGGFDVVSAPTGNTGLLSLCQEQRRIDWLVTKVAFPGLVDGWLLADQYHQHHADRPVIFLSREVPEAECPSIDALFVRPAAPVAVLETLKALSGAELVQASSPMLQQAA